MIVEEPLLRSESTNVVLEEGELDRLLAGEKVRLPLRPFDVTIQLGADSLLKLKEK
jgi:hypothetical protein